MVHNPNKDSANHILHRMVSQQTVYEIILTDTTKKHKQLNFMPLCSITVKNLFPQSHNQQQPIVPIQQLFQHSSQPECSPV